MVTIGMTYLTLYNEYEVVQQSYCLDKHDRIEKAVGAFKDGMLGRITSDMFNIPKPTLRHRVTGRKPYRGPPKF